MAETGLTVQDVLVTALKKPGKWKFKRFKEHLCEWEVTKGYIKITKDQLKGKDPDHVADLIRRHYTDSYGTDVTLAILETINEKKVREKLQHDLMKATFMDKLRSDLIRRIMIIDPVLHDLREQGRLTQEQYKDLSEKPTSLEKMRGLCDTIRYWDVTGKDMAYRAVRRHNSSVINDLESGERWRKQINHHYVNDIWIYPVMEIINMDPVLEDLLDQKLLSRGQYDRVITNITSRDRMTELRDIVTSWDDIDKDLFYLTLRKHNYSHIRCIERDRNTTQFVGVFQSDLVEKITVIDPVLNDLLDQKLLTQEQYNDLIKKATSEDKMRGLYKTVRFWSYTDKDMFYLALRKHNYTIIRDLERANTQFYPYSLSYYPGENILRKHQSYLIKRIIMVDPVLDDLLEQKLLTQKQYNELCKKTTSEDKMRDLCHIVSSWGDPDKRKVFMILRRYNSWVTRDLEDQNKITIFNPPFSTFEDHFVDICKPEIIRRIIVIDPVLDDLWEKKLLTREQYDDLNNNATYEDKTRNLYDIVRNWEDADKDTFCGTLKIYNYSVISDLEDEDRKELGGIWTQGRSRHSLRKCAVVSDSSFGSSKAQSRPRHQFDFLRIKRNKKVQELQLDDDLKKLSMTEEQWDVQDSDYEGVDEEEVTQKEEEDAVQVAETKKVQDHKMGQEEPVELQYERSKTMFSSPPVCSEPEGVDCKLCGKVKDSSYVITPSITGSTYRLELNSPGLFCCSETGIKFQVSCQVTIEYELDSWGNYVTLIQNQTKGYEIIGPLFNIKSNIEPGAVSAVYLPHCLCLKGFERDQSWIKCFHMKDENTVLETPTRIEPYYVVLEHPTFSCVGVLMYHWNLLQDDIIKHIPFHGKVLLYCKIIWMNNPEYKEYRIHLYLTPSYISMEKAVNKHETLYGYQRMNKPPQTDCVYTKKKYIVRGPQSACVVPKMLLFHCSYPSEPYPFTEIITDGNDINTNIDLYVLPEENDISVWEAKLTKGDINHLASPTPGPTNKEVTDVSSAVTEPVNHFVDIHRPHLIRMISMVDPVLDDLLDQGLLTDEQNDTVLSKPTSQEKMRELYCHIRSWGNNDKDKFYQALSCHNYPVIKRLETGVKAITVSDTSTSAFRCQLF
ncbi:uncharacterized protein LOC142097223 [Mixophyes fleayi]|uniref:uncharacterized protein LOC142097223 n=1 Tax=Mixophyes fleayi TaxID=3061075 RepID=UPI003F4D7D67